MKFFFNFFIFQKRQNLMLNCQIAARFAEYKIHSVLLVGGFEAYQSTLQLYEARGKFPQFCIPMVCIPATISNNVPGSDFSLGCDTSLNEIVEVRYSYILLLF